MKMNEFQESIKRTAMPHETSNDEINEAVLGISGEAGEISDMWKKVRYHGHYIELNKFALEIGDVMYYCGLLADVLGFTLDEIVTMNIEKRLKRYPKGFSSYDSIKRSDEKDSGIVWNPYKGGK